LLDSNKKAARKLAAFFMTIDKSKQQIFYLITVVAGLTRNLGTNKTFAVGFQSRINFKIASRIQSKYA
jgi:hypothetical protein